MAHFCSNCGGSVEPNQKFCPNCGSPVVEAGRATYSSACATPQAQVISGGSPLSRAWADFKAEKGLIGKIFVLAVLSLIPIANFLALGYCLMYGVNSALGRKSGLPEKIASGPLFFMGLLSFVVSLVWGLVVGVLGSIPFFGLLVSLAFIILIPCLSLCIMRLGLYGSLGSAFELSKVWDLFKPNMGNALAIYWIPGIVVVVASIAVGIVLSIFGGFSVIAAAAMGDAAGAMASLGGLSLVLILGLLVISFVSAAASLVSYRAFGYFVAERAPQWARDGLAANPQTRF